MGEEAVSMILTVIGVPNAVMVEFEVVVCKTLPDKLEPLMGWFVLAKGAQNVCFHLCFEPKHKWKHASQAPQTCPRHLKGASH